MEKNPYTPTIQTLLTDNEKQRQKKNDAEKITDPDARDVAIGEADAAIESNERSIANLRVLSSNWERDQRSLRVEEQNANTAGARIGLDAATQTQKAGQDAFTNALALYTTTGNMIIEAQKNDLSRAGILLSIYKQKADEKIAKVTWADHIDKKMEACRSMGA